MKRLKTIFNGIPNDTIIQLLFAILIFPIVSAFFSCSTYHSHYYQKPLENKAGWKVLSEESNLGYDKQYFAEYRNDRIKISVKVPLSGNRQQFAGPVLIPFLPIKKDRPMPLQVHFRIDTVRGIRWEAYPGRWNAVTKGEDPFGNFPKEEVKTSRPFRVVIPNSLPDQNQEQTNFPEDWKLNGKDSTMLQIFYHDAYDLSFFEFTLTNMVFMVDGIRIDIPPLVFERKSEGRYNPYTPQFLDVL